MKHQYTFADLVLYEDEHYAVVNKPPFLSTLADRVEPVNLLAMARAYVTDAQACHRLDKDTSGALAFAKDPEAYRHLSLQFQHREVEKVYHAVVEGIHKFSDELVDQPILKVDNVARISRREGKSSETRFTTIATYYNYSVLECRPLTGRMHQIRVHLAHLGAPIVGDELYGGKPFYLSAIKRGYNLKKFTDEQPIMRRMALHAFSLQFQNLAGAATLVEAPYPKDMQALVNQLSRKG
ncbi:MAG: RluA family pseudouridine synthase [Bacteroidia bacterium]|nr:RluA family pseudouridine synthase [Bacteroidia bacterium]